MSLRFHVDMRGDPSAAAIDTAQVMRRLRQRMLLVGQYIQGVWVGRAQQLNLSHSGDYIRGITEGARIRTTFRQTGPAVVHASVVVTNTSQHAAVVEDGHGTFHLPSRINWNTLGWPSKIKRARDGTPYLHVPFRHHTAADPAAGPTYGALRSQMPAEVEGAARQLARRMPLKSGPRLRMHSGGTTGYLAADRYRWQGSGARRLTHHASTAIAVGPTGVAMQARRSARTVAGLTADGREATNPAWKSSRFHGMFKTGARGHSRYLTVRTMTPKSEGWWIPAKAGRGVARQVATALRSGGGARKLRALLDGIGGR